MWIFGYGSLLWKVDFPFDIKMVGHVRGFERKFYQYSTDHRGTPEKPGRVATLIPSKLESEVWGIAYRIKKQDVQGVIEHLDLREKGGYKRMQTMFHPKTSDIQPFQITIYVGTNDNLNYAGEADESSIAKQIVQSAGPSGSNVEYVCNLAKSMREIAPHIEDKHLFRIEAEILFLLNAMKQTSEDVLRVEPTLKISM